MDVDAILEPILGTYRRKCINEDKLEKLEEDRVYIESTVCDITDEFVGRPNNYSTRSEIRDTINRQLGQFLDVEVTLDDISMDRDRIIVDMTYRPRDIESEVSVHGSVTATTVNPVQDVISHSL